MISLEKPQRKWASSLQEGRTSWIFSSCGRWSQLTTGTSGTRSGGLRKGQSPSELLGGLSGFLSCRFWRLRPCVESVPEPEESSGYGTHSTQDLRPRQLREWNPERPPSNSHGDWPFLRPPERVPEVPVVSREHMQQLEKIQEVLPSRRDEAHFR